MPTVRKYVVFIPGALLMALIDSSAHGSIVVNGGFEQGTGTTPSNWTVVTDPNATAAGATNGRVTSPVNGGTYAEEVQALNSTTSPSGEDSNIQEFTALSGGDPVSAANGPYTLNYYLDGSLGASGVIYILAQYTNSTGGVVSGAGSITYSIPASVPSTFTDETLNLGTPPASATGVYLQFNAITGGVSGGSATAFLDDISVTGTAVPEPATVGICCTAASGLLLMRRRRVR